MVKEISNRILIKEKKKKCDNGIKDHHQMVTDKQATRITFQPTFFILPFPRIHFTIFFTVKNPPKIMNSLSFIRRHQLISNRWNLLPRTPTLPPPPLPSLYWSRNWNLPTRVLRSLCPPPTPLPVKILIPKIIFLRLLSLPTRDSVKSERMHIWCFQIC